MSEPEPTKPNTNSKGCAIGCLGLVALFIIIALVSCSGSSDKSIDSTLYVPPSPAASAPASSNTSDSSASTDVSCTQYLGAGTTAQIAGSRALLNGARQQQGVSTPASSTLVSSFATQIGKLCSTSGYSDLDDGALEAAAAIYTASPEVWNS